MAQIQRKYNFANGSRTDAEQVDEEFDNLIQGVNTVDVDIQNHKGGGDHDYRYYTKSQTDVQINNALVTGTQSKIIQTGNVLPLSGTEGHAFYLIPESRLYIFSDNQWVPQKTDVAPLQKEIANLNLQLAANQLVSSGKTYGWDTKTSFGVIVDFTKGKTTAQLNAGDTDLEGKVTMSQGTFVAGKKVTVIGRNPADDSIVKEQATITSVSPLTISPLVNSYKTGAWIKRSTANNTTNGIKFGGVDDSVIKTVTDATVAGAAYDTSGNNARKLVQLSNGWLVSVVVDGTTTRLHVYKPLETNPQWTQLCFISQAVKPTIVSHNNRVIVVYKYGTSMKSVNIDVTTVANVDVASTAYTFTVATSSDRADDTISAVIGNNEIHVSFSRLFTSHSNSVNIGYVKGTINTEGNVTWNAVEQWTLLNSAGYEVKNPSISLKNNQPLIFCEAPFHFSAPGSMNTTGKSILVITNNTSLSETASSIVKSGCSIGKVYDVSSNYVQSSPSAIFVPQSVNGLANGRIWVAWHGTDSTDTAVSNIRISYSDDGGVTWSAMQKLTSGNTTSRNFPSITANKSGKVFVLVINQPSGQVEQVSYDGTWSGLSVVASAGQGSVYTYPSTLFDLTVNFTAPLFIYKTTAKVGFYGTWTIGTEAPITENTLRLTLTQQAKEVMTYLHHTAGLTATAQVNGNVMDKTTTAEETQFTRVLGSLQDIEIEITLTRASVNDDITIDKILGGVA